MAQEYWNSPKLIALVKYRELKCRHPAIYNPKRKPLGRVSELLPFSVAPSRHPIHLAISMFKIPHTENRIAHTIHSALFVYFVPYLSLPDFISGGSQGFLCFAPEIL